MRAVMIITCCLPILGYPATADEVTLVLQHGKSGYTGTQDAWISVDGRISKRNLGGMHYVSIWQDDGVALIRFDLSFLPRTAKVKSVALELFAISTGFAAEEIARSWNVKVFECTERWIEGNGTANGPEKRNGATIDLRDGSKKWSNGSATAAVGHVLGETTLAGGDRKWYKWSLKKGIVQDWIAGRRVNYGMIVWGKRPGKAVSFTAHESTAVEMRPILRLTLAVSKKDAEAIALGQAIRSKAAVSKLPGGSDGRAIEHKLAIVHSGHNLASDDETVGKFRLLIDSIKAKCPNQSREEIGAMSFSAKNQMEKYGVKANLLELMTWLDKSIPSSVAGQYNFSDVAAAFAVYAISPTREVTLEEIHLDIAAMLKTFATKQ